jgi:CHAT domain-containing protein
MTWKSSINKLLNIIISPFQTKKSSQSIIQSLDGLPSEFYKNADKFQSTNNFTDSLLFLIKAYESADKLYGSDNEKTIFLLSEVAKNYKTLGRNTEAANYYQEVVDNMAKSRIELPNTLEILKNLLAIYINIIKDINKALLVQTHIVSIEEKLEGIENIQLATSIMNLGYLKLQLGQYTEAIALDNKALVIFDQAQVSECSDAILLRSNLALAYIGIGDYERATFFLKQALDIQEKKGKLESINSLIFNNMAIVSRNKGLDREAANLQEKALAIDTEIKPDGGFYTLALLDNLMESYQKLDDVKHLLPILKKRVTVQQKILGVVHPKTLEAIDTLANELAGLGKYNEALSTLQYIDNVPEKNGGFVNIVKLFAMLLKSDIYKHLGDLYAANKILNQALIQSQKLSGYDENVSKIFTGNHNPFTSFIRGGLSINYFAIGDINNATSLSQMLKDDIRVLPELKFDKNNVFDLFNMAALRTYLFSAAQVKLSQNSFADAITLEAKEIVLNFIYLNSYRDSVADGLHDLSLPMYKVNPNAAIALSKMGINMLQSLRHDLSSIRAGDLQFFTKSIKDRYQSLAEMLVKQGRLAEAQEVIELLKMYEFNKYTRGASNQDPSLDQLTYTEVEQSLIAPYEVISSKIIKQSKKLTLLNRGIKTQAEQNLAIALVKELNKNQEVFVEYIKSIAVDTTKTTFPETQPTAESLAYLKKLQETIKNSGSDVALLRYYLTEDSLGVIITGASGQFSKSVAIKNSELSKKIVNFNQLLRNPKLDPRSAAEELYKLVFEPVVEDLEKIGAKTVMLSLDGILRYIPFAALYDGKHYLVERYRLPIFTSAVSNKLNDSVSPPWQVSAMGVTQSIRDFPALPGVQAEVDGIVRHGSEGILPGQILLDNNFTSLALKEATKQNFPVLHIASHFVFSPGTEVNSFLLMGDGQELTLGDIRTQNFDFSHVDLLTLSACETGMGGGVDDDGREIEGFGVTAQRQGAKSVLATLWPVADKSTAILMKDFYQLHQEQKLSKAEALREAQLDMLNGTQDQIVADKKVPASTHFKVDPKKPYAHPFYWAPFILMGNWI